MTKLAISFLFLVSVASAADVVNPFAQPVAAVTSNEVLASVRIGRDGGCSGTIIARGDELAYGISAAHCGASFDSEFKIGFVDGSIGSARWKAVDAKRDLALFVCWSSDVLAHAPVPDAVPNGELRMVGFPHTRGPKLSTVSYFDANGTNGSSPRVRFNLVSGEFGPGSSGGGVFRDGVLTSVTTNGHDGGPAYGCTHADLMGFVRENSKLIREGAPLVQCVNGVCLKDGNGRWTPSPNTPIVLPLDGTFPDRESSKIIVALSKRVDELERRLALLESKGDTAPPPPLPKEPIVAPPVPKEGVAGKDGKDGLPGRDGKDGKSGVVTVILTDDKGNEITRSSGVQSGSVVRLREKKTLAKGN